MRPSAYGPPDRAVGGRLSLWEHENKVLIKVVGKSVK